MSRVYKITSLLFALTHSVGCSTAGGGEEARLRLAACEGRVEVVRALVTARVAINAKGGSGDTPLIAAEACGRKEESAAEIVRMLIDHGADVNARGKDRMTALMFAARHGHPQVIRQLLAKGADPNARGAGGETALIYAASNGCDAEALKLLVEAGADVNARNDKGLSALGEARASKACPGSTMAQMLIERGAE